MINVINKKRDDIIVRLPKGGYIKFHPALTVKQVRVFFGPRWTLKWVSSFVEDAP